MANLHGMWSSATLLVHHYKLVHKEPMSCPKKKPENIRPRGHDWEKCSWDYWVWQSHATLPGDTWRLLHQQGQCRSFPSFNNHVAQCYAVIYLPSLEKDSQSKTHLVTYKTNSPILSGKLTVKLITVEPTNLMDLYLAPATDISPIIYPSSNEVIKLKAL